LAAAAAVVAAAVTPASFDRANCAA
jgi:hypothetical protein